MQTQNTNTHDRIQRLATIFEAQQLDGIIVSCPSNVFYLSGFSGSFGYLLCMKDGKHSLLTDGRYTSAAKASVSHFSVVEVQGNTAVVAASCFATSVKKDLRLGFESEFMTVKQCTQLHDPIQKIFKETHQRNIDFVAIAPELSLIRAIKEPAEIEALRAAVTLADDALKAIIPKIVPGVSELEIAAELEYYLKIKGASGTSFETIVASGPRSALPHGVASSKTVQAFEPVMIDFGAKLGHYCSDITRTLFLGEPTHEMRALYDIVLSAQTAAIAQCAPGKTVKEIDAVARSIIQDAGYGDAFAHGLGHGVGIDIHEAPSLNARSEQILVAGNIVTIEPGIYLPGKFGVRIEDMVRITDTGYEILTGSAKELQILNA